MEELRERLRMSEEERGRAVTVVVKQSEEFRQAEAAIRTAEAAYAVSLEKERMNARLMARELEAIKRSLRDVTNRWSERPAAESRVQRALQEEQQRRMELEIENKAVKKKLAEFHRSGSSQETREVEFELERQNLQFQMVEKENIIRGLRDRVQGMEVENRDAKSRNDELAASLEAREKDLKNAHRTIADIVGELEQQIKKSNETQEELSNEEIRLGKLQEDRANLRGLLVKQDAKLKSSSEFIRALTARLGKSRRENFSLQAQVLAANDNEKKLNDKLVDLEAIFAQREAEAFLAREEINEMEEVSRRTHSDLLQARREVRMLEHKLNSLNPAVGDAPLKNNDEQLIQESDTVPLSSEAFHLMQCELETVESTLAERTKKLLKTERQIRSQAKALSTLQDKLSQAYLEVETMKASIKAMEDLPMAREEEIKELNTQIAELQGLFIDNDSLTRSKNAEVGRLREKLQVTEDNLQQKSKELRSTSHSLEEAFRQMELQRQLVNDKEEALTMRENECAKLRETIAKQEDSIGELRSVVGSSTKQNSEIKQNYGNLNLKFKEKQDELVALEYERNNIQSTLEEAQEKIKLLERTARTSQDEIQRISLELHKVMSDRNRQAIESISSRRALESNEKLMEQMKQELSEARLEVERQQAEVRIMRENSAHQFAALAALQTRLQESEAGRALSHSSSIRAGIDGELELLEQQKANLADRLSMCEERSLRMQDEITLMRRSSQAHIDEIGALKAICAASDSAKQNLSDEITSLSDSLALKHSEMQRNALSARHSVEEARETIRSLEIIVEGKQEMIVRLGEDLQGMKNAVAAITKQRGDLDMTNTALRGQMESLTHSLQVKTEIISNLEMQKKEQMSFAAEAVKQRIELEHDLYGLRRQLESITHSLQFKSEMVVDLEARMKEQSNGQSKLRHELQTRDEELAMMRTTADSKRAELDKAIAISAQQARTIETLEQSLRGKRDEIQSCQKQLDAMDDRMRQLTSAVETTEEDPIAEQSSISGGESQTELHDNGSSAGFSHQKE